MNNKEKLVEQHIREYELRHKHLDELIDRAKKAAANLDDEHELKTELGDYHQQQSELLDQTNQLKKMPLEHWREETIQSAGPMGIFDILAQKIENLIERLER
jgi:3'-phosphoadenosine 5'-phosphosulfate sulfotransferase (PAPS reductase)/FAD synthetase